MNKLSFLNEAKEILNELIEWRRYLHQNPEVGFDLPNTSKFVKDKLTEFGYEVEHLLEHGLIAEVGQGDKTILLRADMDGFRFKKNLV